nr:unnamed protein product [Haemonchus contortus]
MGRWAKINSALEGWSILIEVYSIWTNAISFIAARCTGHPYQRQEAHLRRLPGDICTLAKNTRNNGTVFAGCMNHGPIPEGPAVCHEASNRLICACSTKDRCNDPTSSLDDFKKLDKKFTHEGVIVPQQGEGGGGEAAGESEGAHSSELVKREIEMETASDTVTKAGATDTEASGASEAASEAGAEAGATEQATTTTTAKKGFDIKNIFGKSAFNSMPLTITVVFSTTIIACVLHF